MRLGSFTIGGTATYGIFTDRGVVDLGARLTKYIDLKSMIAAGAFCEARAFADRAERDATLEDIAFRPVIPNPGKIFCIGHNYEAHRLETGRDKTAHPLVFLRLPDSQIGHAQPMLRPRESTSLDFEGEIAIVIGKPGRRIAENAAFGHVAGYSCYNDGSVRDWQRHASQFTAGKNFVGTGAFGPWLVTADEIPPTETLTLVTRLNGHEVQRITTDLMIFPIPRLIAYCSTFAPLAPGDVIVTGTPGGVGARRDPPLFMQPGDTVEVEVSRVGCLRNPIVSD